MNIGTKTANSFSTPMRMILCVRLWRTTVSNSLPDEISFCIAANGCREISLGTWSVPAIEAFGRWSIHSKWRLRHAECLFHFSVNVDASDMEFLPRRSTESQKACTWAWCTLDKRELMGLTTSHDSLFGERHNLDPVARGFPQRSESPYWRWRRSRSTGRSGSRIPSLPWLNPKVRPLWRLSFLALCSGLLQTRGCRGFIFHVPQNTVERSLCRALTSNSVWGLCDLSRMKRSNIQSKSTRWVQETCLQLGRHPSMIVRVTAFCRQKCVIWLEMTCLECRVAHGQTFQKTFVCQNENESYARDIDAISVPWHHNVKMFPNLKPVSSEMMSDPALLWETAVCFLYIQTIGTNVCGPNTFYTPLDVVFESCHILQKKNSVTIKVCNPRCCVLQNNSVCNVEHVCCNLSSVQIVCPKLCFILWPILSACLTSTASLVYQDGPSTRIWIQCVHIVVPLLLFCWIRLGQIWPSMHGVSASCNTDELLQASSQYRSTLFAAWPSELHAVMDRERFFVFLLCFSFVPSVVTTRRKTSALDWAAAWSTSASLWMQPRHTWFVVRIHRPE